MRVLVTGGAGFVGSNLVNSLLTDGLDVTVFDAMLRRGAQANIAWLQNHQQPSRLRLVKDDDRNFGAVENATRQEDVIYHRRGPVAVRLYVIEPHHDYEINRSRTVHGLQAG